jgi:hypothetical protein
MISERPSTPWSLAALVLAAAGLAGCATPPRDEPREYLDSSTAATITVGGPTLVFARERPELAVNARDYVTLVPIDVNRAGTHTQYYYGYLWSTIDKRRAGAEAEPASRLELLADGRRIALRRHEGPLRELGLGDEPLPPPSRSAAVLVAPTTREVQSFVADATELRAVATVSGSSEQFELWSR